VGISTRQASWRVADHRFDGLHYRMVIRLENDQRLSLQTNPKIYRSVVYNIYRLRKESKCRASFIFDIIEDHRIKRGLIEWISGFKSDRRLSLGADSNFYRAMAYNPYQICEAGKSHTCFQCDIIKDHRIIRDLDRKAIGFQNGRRLIPRADPKFYTPLVYFLCQLHKAIRVA